MPGPLTGACPIQSVSSVLEALPGPGGLAGCWGCPGCAGEQGRNNAMSRPLHASFYELTAPWRPLIWSKCQFPGIDRPLDPGFLSSYLASYLLYGQVQRQNGQGSYLAILRCTCPSMKIQIFVCDARNNASRSACGVWRAAVHIGSLPEIEALTPSPGWHGRSSQSLTAPWWRAGTWVHRSSWNWYCSHPMARSHGAPRPWAHRQALFWGTLRVLCSRAMSCARVL